MDTFIENLLYSKAAPVNLGQYMTGANWMDKSFLAVAWKNLSLREAAANVLPLFGNKPFSDKKYQEILRTGKSGVLNKEIRQFWREVNKQVQDTTSLFSGTAPQRIAEQVAEFEPVKVKGVKRGLGKAASKAAKKAAPSAPEPTAESGAVVEVEPGDLGATPQELTEKAKSMIQVYKPGGKPKSMIPAFQPFGKPKSSLAALKRKEAEEIDDDEPEPPLKALKLPQVPLDEKLALGYEFNTATQKNPPSDVSAAATTSNLFMPSDSGENILFNAYEAPEEESAALPPQLQQLSKNPNVPFSMGQAIGTDAQVPTGTMSAASSSSSASSASASFGSGPTKGFFYEPEFKIGKDGTPKIYGPTSVQEPGDADYGYKDVVYPEKKEEKKKSIFSGGGSGRSGRQYPEEVMKVIRNIAQGDETAILAEEGRFFRHMLSAEFHRALVENRRPGESVDDMYSRIVDTYASKMTRDQQLKFRTVMNDLRKQQTANFPAAEKNKGYILPSNVDPNAAPIKVALQNLGDWIDQKIDPQQIGEAIGGIVGFALGESLGKGVSTGVAAEGAGVFLGSYIGQKLKQANKWLIDTATNAMISTNTRDDLKFSGPAAVTGPSTLANTPTNLSVTAIRQVGGVPGLTQADKEDVQMTTAQQYGLTQSSAVTTMDMKNLKGAMVVAAPEASTEKGDDESTVDEDIFMTFPDKDVVAQRQMLTIEYGKEDEVAAEEIAEKRLEKFYGRNQAGELDPDPFSHLQGRHTTAVKTKTREGAISPTSSTGDRTLPYFDENTGGVKGSESMSEAEKAGETKYPVEMYKALEGPKGGPVVAFRGGQRVPQEEEKEEKEGKGEEEDKRLPIVGDMRRPGRVVAGTPPDSPVASRPGSRVSEVSRGSGGSRMGLREFEDDEEESEAGSEALEEEKKGIRGRRFRRRPVDGGGGGGGGGGYNIMDTAAGKVKPPLLRPEFPVGSSALVEEVNENPTAVLLDKLMWQSFRNYQWETNEESDNILYQSALRETHLRFSDNFPIDKDGSKGKFALYLREMHDPVLLGLKAGRRFREEGAFIGQCTTGWDGNSLVEGEPPFRDVFMPADVDIPENSPYKTFTATNDTNIPDSERLQGGKISMQDSEKWEMVNQFITSTVS